jgi:trans-aconitate 2-methyltransferase
MLVRLFCFLLLSQMGIQLSADVSYWDARLVRSYVHHSELQRRWAWSFLAPYLKSLEGNEQILDIGCGDGKISADIAKFVPSGSVIGIDLSQPMLEWAKKQFHVLEYPNLTFQEGSFLEPNLSGSFDLIVSFCALHHCSDQKGALQNIGLLLKPGGKLLLLVPAINNWAWKQAFATVLARQQWAACFTPRKIFNAQQYVELLELANLHVIKVEATKTMDPFIDREEILDWFEGTFTPVAPQAESRKFYNEWVEEYLRLDPQAITADGVIYAQLGYITIEATLAF